MKSRKRQGYERFARFALAVMAPTRAEGGWKSVPKLAEDAGVSLATAYRHLADLEAGGLPLERLAECSLPQRRKGRGVRCLVELRRPSAKGGQA